METRTALENTVKLHKESIHKQRGIEAEITVSYCTTLYTKYISDDLPGGHYTLQQVEGLAGLADW